MHIIDLVVLQKKRHLFSFDVESVGLHGEGFAVGYVLYDALEGVEIEAYGAHCTPWSAIGPEDGRLWVAENVKISSSLLELETPFLVREWFWRHWQQHRHSSIMVCDSPYPVEARFLNKCIDQGDREHRALIASGSMYPIIDVTSWLLARGIDALSTSERLPSELPAHDPINDARHSLRQLIEA